MPDFGLVLVSVLRLVGPLLILRRPLLGAVLSEYVFDAFDVVIWDVTRSSALSSYTQFDKIFDTYQLIIMAFIASKWPQLLPRRTALFLFAYRMMGFVLYEIIHIRLLFFVFPSFLVLYFIGYYLAKRSGKLTWFTSPKNLPIIIAVMLVLKMPQEYILHFAEAPTWDIIKDFIF